MLHESKSSRRNVIAAGAALVASGTLAASCARRTESATFVLVHGAWHGGWCWQRVAEQLTANGHRVFAPTLTGLCERSHLLHDSVNLTTHVLDVVNEIEWKDLTDVVLVGHSYGGMVITGVAERVGERLASIIYLDAFLPEDGQSLSDIVNSIAPGAMPSLDATSIPAVPAAGFNVNEADRAWVDSKLTPQPTGTMIERLAVTGAFLRVPRKAFIGVTVGEAAFFQAVADRYAADPAWRVQTIDCGHDAMIDKPAELAVMLEALA